MTTKTVLLVGDCFTDKWILSRRRGMSAEATIPVYDVTQELEFPGGMANVWRNLQTLGGSGLVQVQTIAFFEYPLPLKTRIVDVDTGQQVARFDKDDICRPVRETVVWPHDVDAVIVSDYGKGAVSADVMRKVIDLDVPLFVDTKRDPTPWLSARDVTFFPNAREFEACAAAYAAASQVVLTRSANGIARLLKNSPVEEYPALCPPFAVKSVCGAGDTVVAAYTYATLANIPSPLWFANAAAAASVAKPYTHAPTFTQINAILESRGYPTFEIPIQTPQAHR